MRTRLNLLALALTSAGIAAVVACGSSPKTEPGAATAAPPATPPTSTGAPTADTDASSTATATTTDAGSDAGGGKAAECDALLADANSELDAERIKVDKQCKKDADCMPIKGRACGFVCTTGAIPKAEEKEWSSELAKVKDGPCKKWADMECAKVNPPRTPTCSMDGKKPSCDKGHCTLK